MNVFILETYSYFGVFKTDVCNILGKLCQTNLNFVYSCAILHLDKSRSTKDKVYKKKKLLFYGCTFFVVCKTNSHLFVQLQFCNLDWCSKVIAKIAVALGNHK